MPPPQLEMFDEFWSPDKCSASLPALPSHAPQHQSGISAGGCTAPVNRQPSPIFSLSFKHPSVTFIYVSAGRMLLSQKTTVFNMPQNAAGSVGERSGSNLKMIRARSCLNGSLHCWDPSMFRLLMVPRCLPALYAQGNSPIHRNLNLSACRS